VQAEACTRHLVDNSATGHRPRLLAACGVLVGRASGWLVARQLDALALGAMAHHLGVRTTLVVSVALACATLMTAPR
jgi:ABC-type Fe3+-siderophore transport system permease subunit